MYIAKSIDKSAGEYNSMELPAELYNSLMPSGLPPHELRLKKVLLEIPKSKFYFAFRGAWSFSFGI